jgi:hypothetical protein
MATVKHAATIANHQRSGAITLAAILYCLCYLWLIAISIVLIHRASAGQPTPRMPAAQQS